jgi:hypothetical protein
LAPGVGLYLDELFFDQYNWKQDNEREYLDTKNLLKQQGMASGNAGSGGSGGRMTLQDIKASAAAAVAAALKATEQMAVVCNDNEIASSSCKRKLEASEEGDGGDDAASKEGAEAGANEGQEPAADGPGSTGSTFIVDLVRW